MKPLHWYPGARIQLMLMGALGTLVLQAREQVLQSIIDIDERAVAIDRLGEVFASANRTLAMDTIDVMRWGLGEMARVQADIGIQEHNAQFAKVVQRLEQSYGDQTAEDVAAAFTARRDYLPNLTDTVWGQADKRERMLASLLDVVQDDANVGAMQMAQALERMWEPMQDGPRWAWTRMEILSPRGRARSSLGLLPPFPQRGVSYQHLRVARTEVAGIQQEMAKQRYLNQPWVEGVNWTLSPGHPRIDICDDYADQNPYRKTDVPAIPHPNCLCVLTPALMDQREFGNQVEGWVAGENDFLDEYADWIGDRAFMEHYPMQETGGLSRWMGRDLPNAPNDLMATYYSTRWSPTQEVSEAAASVWDKVKERVR